MVENDYFDATTKIVPMGIDFGTTNSLIAFCDSDSDSDIKLIIDKNGKCLIKSCVSFVDNKFVIGNDIDYSCCDRYVKSVKRLIGRKSDEIYAIKDKFDFLDIKFCNDGDKNNHNIKINVGYDNFLTPIQISVLIFRYLLSLAYSELNADISQVVVTVPAYFGENERSATRKAAIMAGFNVLRLINEPTAAALAYGVDNKNGIYVVFDLGGGTFDVSVLRISDGVFKVIATGGDLMLGGDDFDRSILDFIFESFNIDKASITDSEMMSLVSKARYVKECLTVEDCVNFDACISGYYISKEITIDEFEGLIDVYVNRTIDIVKNVLHSVELDGIELRCSDIDKVILVGGAVKTRLISKKVREVFGQDKILDYIDGEKVVAYGAALHAHSLVYGSKNLLIDVVPISLGIEVADNLVERVIERNTPIPVSKKQIFTTQKDHQTGIAIKVCQGESDNIFDNKIIAKFELTGIPDMDAGCVKVEVNFEVDADGLLTVSAKEVITGIHQVVTIEGHNIAAANVNGNSELDGCI